jgi:hypothetical protein
MGWAESLGHVLGQGVARGLNGALAHFGGNGAGAAPVGPRKRGRPAKPFDPSLGVVPASMRCKAPGCVKPARAKGLCSQHYQASRRKKLAKA